MPTWTQEQEAALTSRGQNLLLSAAAGSGKTAVLTERIIRLIADPQAGCSIQDLLVLTFTKAAAAEMKQRVGTALMAALRKADEENDTARVRHLERQAALLPSAQISTLDSFFQSLIRQYFYLLDLDPKTRILSDENENYLLSRDVLAGVLETWYEKGDQDFLDLADFFASRYQDAELRHVILSLYDFSRSLPFPEEWLRHLPDAYHVDGGPDSIHGSGAILSAIRGQGAKICDLYRQLFAILEQDAPAREVYGDQMGEEYTYFSQLPGVATWEALYALPSFAFPKIKTPSKAQLELFHMSKTEFAAGPAAQAVKDIRDEIKKVYNDAIAPILSIPASQWSREMSAMEPLVRVLSAVTLDFSAALAQRKKEERVMDFNDMEHYALSILLRRDDPAFTPERAADFPSEAALAIRARYKEVMIDEYQDTNGIQELITSLIASGHNRFMVGDIKQSIYRFRQADPGIFLTKYNTYSADPGAENRRIGLNKNFRSDGALLSSINFLFRQLMTPGTLELSYGDAEALYPGRHEDPRPDGYVGGSVDIGLIDKKAMESPEVDKELKELESITLEGRLIARRIQAMMEGGMVMNKDGTFRPITYGDMVILLRSAAGKGPLLLKVLEENHIPAVSDREDDFVRNSEVELLLALLKLLDNPLQDIPAAAVLRSHFVGLTEPDLARLRLYQKDKGAPHLFPLLADAAGFLPEEAAAATSHFLALFQKWRSLSMADGTAPLIRTILADTDYLTYLSGLSRGAARKSHVMAFYHLALSRDSSSHNGLYSFLDYIAKLSKDDREFKSESSGNAAGAVRIMTIHRSKGLEFPVVFLAGAGQAFRLSYARESILCHKTLGLGIRYYDKAHHAAWPTLYWYALEAAMAQESRAEEARLLYVAMTRARDKLIITATDKDAYATLSSFALPLRGTGGNSPTPLPAHLVTGAKSFLSWILPAVLRSRDLADVWARLEEIPAYQDDAPGDHSRFRLTVTPEPELFTAAEKARLEETGPEKAPVVDLPKETETRSGLDEFLSRLPPSAPAWMDRQLTWTYGHKGATETPAKLTATAAVKLRESQEYRLADEPPYPSATLAEEETEETGETALPADYAEPPAFLQTEEASFTGTGYGTLMHKAMELLDFTTLPAEEDAIRSALKALGDKGAFTEDELRTLLSTRRKTTPLQSLTTFARGPLAALMKEAVSIRKEMPFSILLPAADFYPQCEKGENLFLQGAMDCLLTMKDGLIIIDYKTDHTMTEEELADHYKVQLQVYGEAAARLFRRPVLRLYLWSFRFGKAIEVEKA